MRDVEQIQWFHNEASLAADIDQPFSSQSEQGLSHWRPAEGKVRAQLTIVDALSWLELQRHDPAFQFCICLLHQEPISSGHGSSLSTSMAHTDSGHTAAYRVF